MKKIIYSRRLAAHFRAEVNGETLLIERLPDEKEVYRGTYIPLTFGNYAFLLSLVTPVFEE